MQYLLVFIFFYAFCLAQFVCAGPVIGAAGSAGSRNLRLLDNTTFLFEYHRHTLGAERLFFTYPRRNYGFVQDFATTERRALIYFADTLGEGLGVRRFAIAASPLFGLDYRGGEIVGIQGDTIWPGVDAGIYLRGYVDSLDFDLDTRFYIEKHSASPAQSFDGEYFDDTNYMRYRVHLGFNYAWARLSIARDVLHWGPGYYNNLTFNQYALPYNMVYLDLIFGPLHVFSIYTSLYETDWDSGRQINKRNLYAHRYELTFGNLTVGLSEIQVLYGENKPWLFTPIVPLFIEKGNYTEQVNNGALAFDVNYRLFQFARLYGEFFLDDMTSPIALYKNRYSNNRWAGMFGMQIAHDFYVEHRLLQLGSIFEIARIEPYTYCHYDYAPALMAHQGYPVGNPNGPNSLIIDWTLYGKYWLYGKLNVFVGIHNKWKWKGEDNGSDIYDPYETKRKRFIHDAKLHYSLTPTINFHGERFGFSGEYSFFDDYFVNIRMFFMI